jgi:AAA15 family ATPase/GTPase
MEVSLYHFGMLMRFRCKNFRSIREEQEFSLVAVATRTNEHNHVLLNTPIKDVKALRCAALYGANASGKSNFLRAMSRFSAIVANSQRKWEPTGEIPYWDPFELDDHSRNAETAFEIDFTLNSVIYNYGFSFNKSAFVDEWLIDNSGRAKTLFKRKTEGSSTAVGFPGKNLGSTSDETKLLDLARLQTRPNSLFLSSAAQSNHELLSSIFKWIIEGFNVLSLRDELFRSYTAEGCSKAERKQQIRDLLAGADVGIVDFRISEEEPPEEFKKLVAAMAGALKEVTAGAAADVMSSPSLRHDIKMFHRGENDALFPLDFSDESAGTRKYFRMLGPILDELQDGSLLLIDELESSLHPSLARQIVRMFNDPILNPKGAQLVFATHDTNLLDLSLLRRDQIWFAEKNDQGGTALKSLPDYKPRKGQEIAPAYLHGRFGAVPILDEGLLRSGLRRPESQTSSPDAGNEDS